MSAVLGVSCHFHDAAAALIVDGVVVSAIQEERLSRIKNDPALPKRAMDAVLAQGGIASQALDRVVFYDNPYATLERVLVHNLRVFPRALRGFPRALASQLGQKLWVLDDLAAHLDVPRRHVVAIEHHQSHAAATYFSSGFSDAAVLTVDGVGGPYSTGLWHGVGQNLQFLEGIEFPHSLGLLYAGITAWLGFRVNEGEYKVMGLAAFGSPTFQEPFSRLVQLHANGSFSLEPAYFAHFADVERGFGPLLERLLGPRRAPNTPWDLSTPADQRYADVAATLQTVLENALLGLARRLRVKTSARHLCLAGGVALNAVANRKLSLQSGFDEIYVHPAAGDAGSALGAAMLGAIDLDGGIPVFSGPFIGIETQAGYAADVARAAGLTATSVANSALEIAERLHNHQLVARCAHRSEWGPRALGARSLLANPSKINTRDALNLRVKRRERFRPFAPAVSQGQFSSHFEGAPNAMTDVMCTVRKVLRPDELAAVTHVDGTARVQSVPENAPLSAILSHIPVVLNTSLNGPGEPIAGSAIDALSFFLRHPVDVLFIDDIRIER